MFVRFEILYIRAAAAFIRILPKVAFHSYQWMPPLMVAVRDGREDASCAHIPERNALFNSCGKIHRQWQVPLVFNEVDSFGFWEDRRLEDR